MAEETTVRENLMTVQGYAPYCGGPWIGVKRCFDHPRTIYFKGQFQCPRCGWRSQFPAEFIERYKQKWNIKA